MQKRKEFSSAIAISFVVVAKYLRIAFHLLETTAAPLWPVLGFVGATSAFTLLFKRREDFAAQDGIEFAILGAGHGLAILSLYQWTVPLGSLAVSGSWLGYAVIVMTIGFQLRDRTLAKSALPILGLAAGKAPLYDAASDATPVRILCLLITGIVLYGRGFLLRRIDHWKAM